MFEFTAIRAALLSPDPWTSMRALVESVLDRGVRLREAAEGLHAWDEQVSEIPDVSEDGYDAFRDTIDDLMGMCSAERKFRERPPIVPQSLPALGDARTYSPAAH